MVRQSLLFAPAADQQHAFVQVFIDAQYIERIPQAERNALHGGTDHVPARMPQRKAHVSAADVGALLLHGTAGQAGVEEAVYWSRWARPPPAYSSPHTRRPALWLRFRQGPDRARRVPSAGCCRPKRCSWPRCTYYPAHVRNTYGLYRTSSTGAFEVTAIHEDEPRRGIYAAGFRCRGRPAPCTSYPLRRRQP